MPLSRLLAASPEEVGVDALAMQLLFDRVSREVSEGRVEGCQVAIARHGRLAGRAAFGTCSGGVPVGHDTLFCCFSCTKATGGIAAWQLMEEGKLSLEQKVVDFIPEFGTHGKEVVTIRQLVTFTAGFPEPADNLFDPDAFNTSEARCAEFAKWELAWEPGSKWEYHSLSAHWVLMEIVERITGVDFRDYLRTRVLDPMGLCDFWVGAPEEIQPDLKFADITTFPPRQDGGPRRMEGWNSPGVRALGVPAGGGQVCASDLCLLYQPLVNGGKVYGGGQICKPETIAMGTTQLTDDRHQQEMAAGLAIPKLRGVVMELAGDDGDITFPTSGEMAADGLVVMDQMKVLAGRTFPKKVFRQGGFGSKVSAGAFGHDGAGGQIAWADPAVSGTSR